MKEKYCTGFLREELQNIECGQCIGTFEKEGSYRILCRPQMEKLHGKFYVIMYIDVLTMSRSYRPKWNDLPLEFHSFMRDVFSQFGMRRILFKYDRTPVYTQFIEELGLPSTPFILQTHCPICEKKLTGIRTCEDCGELLINPENMIDRETQG